MKVTCVSFNRITRQSNLRARRLQHSEARRASRAGCAQAEELGILAALLASRCFVGARTAVSSRPSMRLCKTSGHLSSIKIAFGTLRSGQPICAGERVLAKHADLSLSHGA